MTKKAKIILTKHDKNKIDSLVEYYKPNHIWNVALYEMMREQNLNVHQLSYKTKIRTKIIKDFLSDHSVPSIRSYIKIATKLNLRVSIKYDVKINEETMKKKSIRYPKIAQCFNNDIAKAVSNLVLNSQDDVSTICRKANITNARLYLIVGGKTYSQFTTLEKLGATQNSKLIVSFAPCKNFIQKRADKT
ncbi:hypothetical protein DY052_08515 [Apilactobacillus timberlakei]|uniref:hypothetical protein n=1 Tax=Apilactobacillus timberlakei TaxID=2008380 RepID=UPI00112A23E7|nr:hypothetical protein [Apilactobacillus timberlakei]TPR13033.1 hypothetical protein DY052_08515 [Apilactobacillus timberlakei]